MKMSLAMAVSIAFAVPASGQVLSNPLALDVTRYDDGTSETAWKIQNPNGPSDYFNVDLDNQVAGACIVGLLCNTADFGGGTIGGVGVYGDNLVVDPSGSTPNLSALFTTTGVGPSGSSGSCDNDTIFDVPDVVMGSGGAHVVFHNHPGDSSLWLCADTDVAGTGRSYFTLDGYSTPAVAHTSADYMLGTAAAPCGAEGTFWVNGGTSTTLVELKPICVLFAGATVFQPWMIFLSSGGAPLFPAVNLILFTGVIGGVDDAGTTSTLCERWPCNAFVGVINFMALYKSSAGPWTFSNEVTVTVLGNPACLPCTDWGAKDDGILDSTIWKIQNPAGSRDYFSVHHGPAPDTVASVTGVEVASWDFCGTGPSWSRVGMYDANSVLDSTGGTPDLSAPVSVVTNPSMPANAAEWAYPATLYDTPDVSPGGADLHSLVHWQNNDTCVWIGSDMDATDDSSSCSMIPSTTSYFSLDGYTSAGIQHTIVNYMQRVMWQ